MKPIDILPGKVTTVVCEPIKKVGKKIAVINSDDKVITEDFFVSYSKPCFSSEETMFISFKQEISVNLNSIIEFIE